MKTKPRTFSEWTVRPYLRPDLDADPMGVFIVEPMAAELDCKLANAVCEKSEAIVHEKNREVARLLESAPDILNALVALREFMALESGDALTPEERDICTLVDLALAKSPYYK